MKLYFRKLGKALLYLLFIGLLFILLNGVLATIVNGLVKSVQFAALLYLLIPVVGASVFTYKKRLSHADERREYLHRLGKEKFSFFTQLGWILRSNEYLAEIAAFFTLLLPVLVGIMVYTWQILGAIGVALYYTLFFAVIDLLLWFLVHRKWASERVSV